MIYQPLYLGRRLKNSIWNGKNIIYLKNKIVTILLLILATYEVNDYIIHYLKSLFYISHFSFLFLMAIKPISLVFLLLFNLYLKKDGRCQLYSDLTAYDIKSLNDLYNPKNKKKTYWNYRINIRIIKEHSQDIATIKKLIVAGFLEDHSWRWNKENLPIENCQMPALTELGYNFYIWYNGMELMDYCDNKL